MASKYNWDDFGWEKMNSDLERVVAISNYYGSDPDFLLAGGGNTSAKTADRMFIKASGTTLDTIGPDGFVELERSKISGILNKSYSNEPLEREAQVKVDMLASRCDQETGARPSVEAMLHEMINHTFVVHSHPCLINGLTCGKKGKAMAAELFGDDAIWIDYSDPGYTLSTRVRAALKRYRAKHDNIDPFVIFIQNHGVFISADDPQTLKTVTDGVVAKLENYMSQKDFDPVFGKSDPDFAAEADVDDKVNEIAPALRAALALVDPEGALPIVTYNGSELVKEFASLKRGEELALSGPFTPDQIVYCKRNPLWINRKSLDEDIESVIARIQAETGKFVRRNGHIPKIVFVKGIGMFAVGDSKKTAETASVIYEDALKIMQNAGAFGGPHFMNNRQASFIDEWEVESYRRKIAASKGTSGRVEGKVAIVTGAAQGFGEGIAKDLAKEGAYIVIADINLEGAQAFADALSEEYGAGKAIAVKTDVTNEESVANMVAEAVRAYGGVDIFVSNAGVLKAGSVKTMAFKDFEFVTRVNYMGYFLCVKHASKVMAAQHRINPEYTANIIQINSKSGLQGSNKNAAYAGSKFGGIGLTQSFALELVEDGIKVNAICPGNFFDGPLWSDPERGLFVQYLRTGKVPGAKTVEDVKRSYESKVPMGRGCTVPDVMRAIYYVIDQPYETGQAIPVTGGQLMK